MNTLGKISRYAMAVSFFVFGLVNFATVQLETNDVEIKTLAPIPGGGAYVGGSFQRTGNMHRSSLGGV